MRKVLSFGMFVAVLAFAGIAMAGTIDADSDTSCTNGTQDNLLSCGENIVLWWNGSDPPSGTYCAEIWDSNSLIDDDDVTFGSSCTKANQEQVYHDGTTFEINAPCTSGSYRIKVCQGSCPCSKSDKNVGGDSFRVN